MVKLQLKFLVGLFAKFCSKTSFVLALNSVFIKVKFKYIWSIWLNFESGFYFSIYRYHDIALPIMDPRYLQMAKSFQRFSRLLLTRLLFSPAVSQPLHNPTSLHNPTPQCNVTIETRQCQSNAPAHITARLIANFLQVVFC